MKLLLRCHFSSPEMNAQVSFSDQNFSKSLQTLLCRAITAHVFIFHSEYLMLLLPGNKKQNEFKQKSLQKYTYLPHLN